MSRPLHVVMFGDQHVETAGGAQVAMRLQRKFLERAGHIVTIVAPARHGRDLTNIHDEAYVDLPSLPVPGDREYALVWPGRRSERAVDRGIAHRVTAHGAPLPDVVHVQGDYWGAALGHRFARRARLPVVHTMHNRVDVGIAATTPFPRSALRVLNAWRRRALPGSGPGSDGWAYLRGIASGATAVTAPSAHFARRLEEHGVFGSVDVVWNGIDDDVLRDLAAAAPSGALIWVGRMSAEKRLLPFLQSYSQSGIDMPVEIVGSGFQREAAERYVQAHGLSKRVRFLGRLSYPGALARIAAASALVQTSIGFETQGMTPFEAAQFGTPSVISDPDIADEMGEGVWRVPSAQSEDGRIRELATTLRDVDRDIRLGSAPAPSEGVRREFVQSSRTAAMIDIYRRVLI
ncbi:glycosyltransferase [Microbacterium karelineae]|uniref:glycosyltransferase n=1 Tax=Microbacterium karelineae TaxID=2654283 RepID=UPI001E353C07|nr:glycosyltransferase [Microbacterium karelineae]